MRSSTRIILIGPKNSDAAEIVEQFNSGFVCQYSDVNKLVKILENRIDTTAFIGEQFSRYVLTKRLSEVLEKI